MPKSTLLIRFNGLEWAKMLGSNRVTDSGHGRGLVGYIIAPWVTIGLSGLIGAIRPA